MFAFEAGDLTSACPSDFRLTLCLRRDFQCCSESTLKVCFIWDVIVVWVGAAAGSLVRLAAKAGTHCPGLRRVSSDDKPSSPGHPPKFTLSDSLTYRDQTLDLRPVTLPLPLGP